LVGVEQWAELLREHFVRGVSIKELSRRTGLSPNTGAGGVALVDAAEVSAGVEGAEAGTRSRTRSTGLFKNDPALLGCRPAILLRAAGMRGSVELRSRPTVLQS
jgi:hypothetical protein